MILDAIPGEMITGLVSSSLGAAITILAQGQANYANTVELALQQQKGNDDSADRAAGRGDTWSKHVIVGGVILTGFVGLILMAFFDIQTTYLFESPIKEHLLGLFKTGGKIESITSNGFLIPPYVSHSVSAIVFFHFGAGAAKVAKG